MSDEADWRDDLYIPASLLDDMALWLTTQQDKETGAFFDQAPLYDRKLWVFGLFQSQGNITTQQPQYNAAFGVHMMAQRYK